VLSQVAESLMDKLAKEAYEVCMVSACIFANLVHNIATLN
jgi:organic hydroperoxide reductase OsmC/OhrA